MTPFLSIHTTTTNPEARKYPYLEALASFCDLADEVIVVDGCSTDGSMEKIKKNFPSVKIITIPWHDEFAQREFPIHLNAGLEACQGTWAFKCDIDFVFHELEIERIRKGISQLDTNEVWLGEIKKMTVQHQLAGCIKTTVPWIINRINPDCEKIRYGRNMQNDRDDWSKPVIHESDWDQDTRIPIGQYIPQNRIKRIDGKVWNYHYFFRNKQECFSQFARGARAFWRDTGKAIWGATDEQAWEVFRMQEKGRRDICNIALALTDHPRYIQSRVANMTPDQYGFDNWQGNFDYE